MYKLFSIFGIYKLISLNWRRRWWRWSSNKAPGERSPTEKAPTATVFAHSFVPARPFIRHGAQQFWVGWFCCCGWVPSPRRWFSTPAQSQTDCKVSAGYTQTNVPERERAPPPQSACAVPWTSSVKWWRRLWWPPPVSGGRTKIRINHLRNKHNHHFLSPTRSVHSLRRAVGERKKKHSFHARNPPQPTTHKNRCKVHSDRTCVRVLSGFVSTTRHPAASQRRKHSRLLLHFGADSR